MPSDGLPKNLEPLVAGDPATIGPYVLSGKLGSGGMGTVYLGSTAEKNNQVAIKVIRPELAFDEQTRARFRDEMENARKVASFCTAKVLDHGTFENRPYMVTEYIAGTALAEHVAEDGPLDSSTLHGFALGVAAALAAIHRTGLVHRDLKPANVLLSISGPRVIDFGIARAMNTVSNHTQTGIVMGSPGWMAPEQLLEEQVTTAADVFAWGCLVAFAGNGAHPFGNGDAMTLGKRVLFAEPQIGNLDSPLDRLVMRALAKEPGRRPTAQDLLLELTGGEDNTNDMVSNALHQSWRPNLPPMMPPGHPPQGMPHPAHQTMSGMQHPGHPPQQAGPPMPSPAAHQTGNFPLPQQAPPPPPQGPPQGHPAAGHPAAAPQGPQNQVHQHPGGPPQAQHPASTGPIPMVPPNEQQASSHSVPQPYVPPVPPPPHRPVEPNRRKGLVLALALGGVSLLIVMILLIAAVINVGDGPGLPWLGSDSAEQDDSQPGAADEEGPEAGDGPDSDSEAAPGDAPGTGAAPDGRAEYRVERVTCGMETLPNRSELSDGEYCVVDMELTNTSDDTLHFEPKQQFLRTGAEGSEGATPQGDEAEAPLWAEGGIAPGQAAEGELVFILGPQEEPEALELSHGEAAPTTEIEITDLVERSN